MRLGLFGGSFDPVHYGHLALAEGCRQRLDLDEVWFVPAAQQPHKPVGPRASGRDRAAMLRIAIEGSPHLAVSTLELDRAGVSYSIDTLTCVRAARPEAELFFLMGADTLSDLPNWRDPQRVLRLATPVVVHRAGQPAPDFDVLAPLVGEAEVERIRRHRVELTPPSISSSELRRRVREWGMSGGKAGEDGMGDTGTIEGLTPPGVVRYIAQHGLYR